MAKVLWVLVFAAVACQVRGFGLGGFKNAAHDLESNTDDDDDSLDAKCPDGLYNNPTNCSTFVQCSNGIAHVMPCPAGLHYSTKTERCERPCDARCDRTYACRCGWQSCQRESCFLPYKAGPCNQTSERYYFDKRTAKCVTFTYGGCRGNENNFLTKRECDKTCSKAIDICRLPKEQGTCDGHFEKYFFNRKTGQCEKFVYGGCGGNTNRFDTKQQCEQKCLRKMDEEEDVCRLPKEVGPCHAYKEKYFFNRETGQCEKFVYGGCGGNTNKFDSRELCELKCLRKSDEDVDVCRLPKEVGPCDGHFEKYFFNRETGQCEKFVYGGCRGNTNRFDTREQCEQKCLRKSEDPVDICRLPEERGPCDAHIEKYYFNHIIGQCVRFVYGGCGGNGNKFDSRQQCEQKCLRKMEDPTDVCRLPEDLGPCNGHFEKYYFNKYIRQCVSFVYGGCGGNGNKFDSREQCEQKCLRKEAPEESESCTLPAEPGTCKGRIPRYFFDKSTGLCTPFIYGGCNGNANNYESKTECEEKCGQTVDVCKLPKETGPCQASFRRWWFNPDTKKCEQFLYGGCRGNGNNFATEAECEKRCPSSGSEELNADDLAEAADIECGKDALHPLEKNCSAYIQCTNGRPVVMPCPKGLHYSIKTSRCEQPCTARCDKTLACKCNWKTCGKQSCKLPAKTGSCSKFSPRYYYDKDSKRCKTFLYSGCLGNENNFATKKDCKQYCESKRPSGPPSDEVCKQPKEIGNCKAYVRKYFFNTESGMCEPFVYGGCGGNENNFESITACQRRCLKSPAVRVRSGAEPECGSLPEVGPCRAKIERYYYNKEAKKCQKFIYGGCGGNGNNYESIDECNAECWKKSEAEPSNDEPDCDSPPEVGPCKAAIPRYYFDKETKECKRFFYGGCRGNGNNYRTIEECQSQCSKRSEAARPEPECESPPEKGDCKAFIPRYYFDKETKECKRFIYGGCLGNGNNYITIEECQSQCSKQSEVAHSDVEPDCDSPPDEGPCKAAIRRYYFDKETKECKRFIYGGCKGNGNNYRTIEECQSQCSKRSEVAHSDVKPECESPPEKGGCKASIPRYFFDKETKECKQFTYGGCGGNGNNYLTTNECLAQCFTRSAGKKTDDWEALPDYCELPPETGPCKANITKFYYDHEEKECKEFQYGGCRGNRNSFYSKEMCERRCKSKDEEKETVAWEALPDYCELPPETGPCKANITKFYYDHEEKECKEFQYGGCQGNRNSFYSKQLCERKCKSKDEEKETVAWEALPEYCELAPETGPCHANVTKFYYDHEEKECKEFQYGGCGGNRNSFYTKELCERKCKSKDEEKEADEIEPECTSEPDVGSCRGHFIRWYYSEKSGTCEHFFYGGCQGNGNNYRTPMECLRHCSKNEDSDLTEFEN